MILRFVLSFLVVLIVAPYAMAQDTQEFLSAMPDVPLPQGAVERAEQTLVFDKPEGRIVESRIDLNQTDPQSTQAYYKQALPQFGWRPAGENRFIREDEELQLQFYNQTGQAYMTIMISPL